MRQLLAESPSEDRSGASKRRLSIRGREAAPAAGRVADCVVATRCALAAPPSSPPPRHTPDHPPDPPPAQTPPASSLQKQYRKFRAHSHPPQRRPFRLLLLMITLIRRRRRLLRRDVGRRLGFQHLQPRTRSAMIGSSSSAIDVGAGRLQPSAIGRQCHDHQKHRDFFMPTPASRAKSISFVSMPCRLRIVRQQPGHSSCDSSPISLYRPPAPETIAQ